MKGNLKISLIFIAAIPLLICVKSNKKVNMISEPEIQNQKPETATFGAGCFWCAEAIFEELKGVLQVESGYAGGHVQDPSYEDVCTGTTGHAEVCQICFDSAVISYTELLEVFWQTHDPTTLNRQGADIGPQYRSVIFYHNDVQRDLAEEMKMKLNNAGIWIQPIVTEIEAYDTFYKAEEYHQDYYGQNMSKPYCSVVIRPKLDKFHKIFADKLKNTR